MEFTPLQIVFGLAVLALLSYTIIMVVIHGHDGFEDDDHVNFI